MTIDPTSSPQDQNNTPIDRSTEPGARSMWHYVWILVIVSGLAAVLGNLGMTAYRANQKAQFKEQLKQVALAIEQYRDTHGRFPPAYTVDADGHRLHSWRTVILPQLGQQDLYEKIHLDEPWDSPHNKQFHTLRPRQYRHTVLSDTVPGEAHLLAVVGRDTMWPEQHSARVADFGRGVSNTGMLLEHSDQEINWMEPRDLTRRDVRTVVFPAGKTTSTGGFAGGVFMVVADGHVRFISSKIQRQLASMLFARDLENRPLRGVDWPPEAAPAMPELPPVQSSSEYPRTRVMPFLNVKLDTPRNVVYCSTMQIAWEGLGEKAQPASKSSEFAKSLEEHPFPKSDLDPSSYVALAGLVADGIIEKIGAEMQRKFPHHKVPKFEVSRQGIISYAYLLKLLPFSVDFERFGVPLLFHGKDSASKVESFGIDSHNDYGNRNVEMISQVAILDHVSDADFILKLRTRARRDEIFLAKVQPQATLKATLDAVLKRIDSPADNGFRTKLGGGDRLMIPVLQLSIDQRFNELLGIPISTAQPLSNLEVVEARQIIKFRLDETGAVIESEAYVIGENGDSHVPRYDANKPRELIFDQPFLLFVRQTKAQNPYLVMWINNDELMENSLK